MVTELIGGKAGSQKENFSDLCAEWQTFVLHEMAFKAQDVLVI